VRLMGGPRAIFLGRSYGFERCLRLVARADHSHAVLGVLAVLMLTAGCDGKGTPASPGAPVSSGKAPSSKAGPPSSNQRILTVVESQRLVDWAVALRACLGGRGLEVEEPSVMRSRIELAVAGSPSRVSFLRMIVRCGDGLGGPPAKSSVQTFASKIVIYLPKQCLLDPKVKKRTL
jgi:hypothetical protein